MKLGKYRNSALLFAAVCGNVLGISGYAGAQAQPSYPLYCHGPLQTVPGKRLFGNFAEPARTPFKWSAKGAGAEAPSAGECAWADRGPRDVEMKAGGGNAICGDLGLVTNLPPNNYAEIGVFRNPSLGDCMSVTQIVGFVAPPFSSRPVLPASSNSNYSCAYCNDGSCQCGSGSGDQLCSNHSGANARLGCSRQQ